MIWLRESISDGGSGKGSAKRLSLLVASLAMSASTVILAVAALFGYDVSLALAAVCTPLAGMSGYGYVGGKSVEAKRKELP